MIHQMSQIHTEAELLQFLNIFEEDLHNLRVKTSRLQFKKMVDKVKIPEIDELEMEFSQKISDPNFAELVNTWDEQVKDPNLQRRLSLWKKMLIKSTVIRNPEVRALTQELGDVMITHQYTVAGEKSDLGSIKNILRTSPDADLRKAAWLGKVALSETLAPDLLKLIRLRNDLARDLGFANYLDFTFQLEGLTLPQVRGMLTDLTTASDPIYHRVLSDGQAQLDLPEIHPWDLMYLLESVGGIEPDLFPKDKIEGQLKRWGQAHHADLKELGIQIVFTDIPYNGLCMKITDGEIKILANPADGHTYFRTLFHELGHALHSAYNQQEHFIFKRDSGILSEGMAELIGYVPRHPDWLKDMGFDSETSLSIQKRLIAPWFHYLRERTANALAEYKIYEDLSQNPDHILAEMDHQVLGVTLDNTPRWAADSWFINYPVYWQNYVLADIVASQIHHTLNQRYGSLHGHPEALAEVRQVYYQPGATIDWQDKILTHTGSNLKADALVKDLELYLK